MRLGLRACPHPILQSDRLADGPHRWPHALRLGTTMLGFRDDIEAYLDVALPVMFPEPKGREVTAMVGVIRARSFSKVVRQVVGAGGHLHREGRGATA